jgi:hypothetical protein
MSTIVKKKISFSMFALIHILEYLCINSSSTRYESNLIFLLSSSTNVLHPYLDVNSLDMQIIQNSSHEVKKSELQTA